MVEVQDVVDEGARLHKGPVEIGKLVLWLDALALATHNAEVLGELLDQSLLVVDVDLKCVDLLREHFLLWGRLFNASLQGCDLVPEAFVLFKRLLEMTQLEALLDHVLLESLDPLFKLDDLEVVLAQLKPCRFQLSI